MSVRRYAVPFCLVLSACAEAPDETPSRAHDLTLRHPAPYANYISVAPGPQDAALPRPGQIKGRAFSRYLRERTGCVMDHSRDMAVLGHKKMPAGYMVPVVCP